MKSFVRIVRVLVVVASLAALVPLGRIALDWVEVSRMLSGSSMSGSARGFDWVLWHDADGLIVARYVFPRSPAARAGLTVGDQFYLLDGQHYFNAEDLKRVVEGIPPGTVRTYHVLRGGEPVAVSVPFTRYPTFLYPLSSTLWYFALWGFTLGAFFHLLALALVGPLSVRSRKARFSLLLILLSSLWMFGTLTRLLLIELFGPPVDAGTYDALLQALTFAGLAGWIGFPAFLLHKVLVDVQEVAGRRFGPTRFVVYFPAVVLGLAALVITVAGHLGPLTLDGLVAPILFYACVHIATAAALVLAVHVSGSAAATGVAGSWSAAGSAVTLAAALLFGLSVLGIVPLFGIVTETIAGWLIVSAQLLSVAPVVLVSLATLKHGKVDLVLSRALAYVTVLGLIFFAFVGTFSLMEPYLHRSGTPRNVIAGLLVVVLLLVFERLGRRVRTYAATFVPTERARMRQRLSRFQEQMRDILDYGTLVQETVQVVGEAFQTRSAALFLRPTPAEAAWISGTYHPEPPYVTEHLVRHLWPHFEQDAAIWARNPELNESRLDDERSRELVGFGAALVIPIRGDQVCGLLLLGAKRSRRAVYNLEDLDLLRALGSQFALAVERLNLVEREKALVRESAEAQLVALRAQINPHFLFNALNTIVSLIAERPEEAEETVEHLAAIFRHTLQAGSRPYVMMEEEFALVDHYLRIEQARFGDRLSVEQSLDPALRTHPVPAFAVQTLVENAVKHGLARQRGDGTLRLTCTQQDERFVEVMVTDTGVGIPVLFGVPGGERPDRSFFGLGLRNVASRLEQLYGRPDLLRLESDPERGTTARLLLPLDAAIDRPAAATPEHRTANHEG